ncbi:alpha/beta hydrolase domain-containing protein [Mycena floridula]|nr:alpha/beta hydrolase domain-containing protein [Mycena floridula]
MDKLAKLEETEVPGVVNPTIQIFLPLLEKKRSEILGVPRKTFQYGATERHQLDIYYPPVPASSRKTKVLFWIYGGGFVTGDRNLPETALVYANLGAYFARQGIITVIPDYRLVPTVRFPYPARDIRDAIEWIFTHPENLVFGDDIGNPDRHSMAVIGHSAGAVHAFTMLTLPELFSPFVQPNISHIVLSSAPFHFRPNGFQTGVNHIISRYWGNMEEVEMKDPMALLCKLPREALTRLPKILLLEAEYESRWIKSVGKDFCDALSSRAVNFEKAIMKGHNHISGSWALSTGQGEEWAQEVLNWCQEATNSKL